MLRAVEVLTDRKRDVEWAARSGRKVSGHGTLEGSGSLTVCTGDLCGRLAVDGMTVHEMQSVQP